MSTKPLERQHDESWLDDDDVVDEPPVKLRRPRLDAEMDITPMIDITFLLLIFFLVASKMDQPAPLDLPPARHGQPVASRDSVIIMVRKGDGERAEITKADGDPFPASDPTEQEELITAYVDDGLHGSEPKHHVLIQAEEDVRTGEVARVEKAAGKAMEGQSLYIGVLEEN